MSPTTILLLLSLISFFLGAVRIAGPVDWIALGLALYIVTLLAS